MTTALDTPRSADQLETGNWILWHGQKRLIARTDRDGDDVILYFWDRETPDDCEIVPADQTFLAR